MKTYGLLGKSLSHSFSKSYFTNKFNQLNIDAQYENFELTSAKDFVKLIRERDFSGLNVTIPYKTDIIKYLDEVDELAQNIGAVNTIKISNGKTKGYNTDYFGFQKSLLSFLAGAQIRHALVLGSGGASLAVSKVLGDLGISFEIVSRTGELNYQNLKDERVIESQLVINTTPLGMFPSIDSFPDIPYNSITENHFLFDLVYNPEVSQFLKKGLLNNAKVQNGRQMLEFQAEKAWEIWNI